MTVTVNRVEKTIDARMKTSFGDVSIVQERFYAPVEAVGVPKDSHHLQLSLLPFPVSSSARFEDVWAPHRFEPMGQLFLFPAHSRPRTRSACEVQRSLVFDLLPHAIVAWFDAEFEWADPHLIASLDIANGAVKQLMNAVISELKRPGFASAAMIELLTAQICLTLARHFDNIDSGRLSGGLAPWRMRRIDEFLRANLGTATISELAEHCELSARHLSRAFQVSYGRSLGRHLTMLRVNLAREMLANGAAIKATAFAVGFAGPTNFATAFRRATGTTPREYRDIQKSSRSVQ